MVSGPTNGRHAEASTFRWFSHLRRFWFLPDRERTMIADQREAQGLQVFMQSVFF